MEKHNVCVIGGMNFAVISKIDGELRNDSSIIGEIKVRFGGVARNIILNLVKFDDIKIDFITVLSRDKMGELAKDELKTFGVDYSRSLFMEKWESFYCETITGSGHYGVNDMKLIAQLKPDYIKTLKTYIESHDMVVLDCNLNQDTLEYIASNIDIPIVCDATSDQKCRRVINVLEHIDIVKMNDHEAYILLGIPPEKTPNIDSLKTALQKLPLVSCYVTLGKSGAFYLSGKDYCYHKPNKEIDAKNVLGAGDSFTAGIIEGALNRMSIDSVLALCNDMAEKTLMQNNISGS